MQKRELLRLLPNILRARDFHLYLDGGKRITDLWLYGGKLLLGHKAAGFLKDLKNSGERGLFSPLPHFSEKRFIKALHAIFPGSAFRLYNEEINLFYAITNYLGVDTYSNFSELPLWRPFGDPYTKNDRGFVVPILPCPLGPYVLVLDKNLEEKIPNGEIISPVILAAAASSLFKLIRTAKEDFPPYYKIEKALKNSNWHRKGIYLNINTAYHKKEEYEEVFKKFFEGGFLLPPSPDEPAILPALMSSGEEAKLASLLLNP